MILLLDVLLNYQILFEICHTFYLKSFFYLSRLFIDPPNMYNSSEI